MHSADAVQVMLLEDFGADEHRELAALLAEADMETALPPAPSPLGGPQYFAWTLVLAAPLVPFLVAFGKRLGERSADDFYDGLTALVSRVWAIKSKGLAAPSERGRLVIEDTEVEGRKVWIEGGPPSDDGLKRIRQSGFSTMDRPVTLYWNSRRAGQPVLEIGEPDETDDD